MGSSVIAQVAWIWVNSSRPSIFPSAMPKNSLRSTNALSAGSSNFNKEVRFLLQIPLLTASGILRRYEIRI
jgi:hypothetical protein